MNQSKDKDKILKARDKIADKELINDIRAAILDESPRGGRAIIWLSFVLLLLVVAWTAFSEVEEVTRGNGKVIPTSQVQIVQNLEGGILSELYVHVGDVVEKGQLLMQLDATRFSAPYDEFRSKNLSLLALSARLKGEMEGNQSIKFPPEVTKDGAEIAKREQALFESRKSELDAKISILQEQATQKKQELAELREKSQKLSKTIGLLRRELEMTHPLIREGAASQIDYLRLQREESSMSGDLASVQAMIPRAESAIKESQRLIEKERLTFSNEAKKQYNEVQAQLEGLSASSSALIDRIDRTAVKSPVYGTVKQILVNTVGGVVQPGMHLVEIVPLEDNLLIEAQIKPSDIAFLRPRQVSMVKFTAYDFTIYGGLEGELEQISADSTTDDKGNSFYLVRVRTKKNYLEGKSGPMPIIPGMVTTVDIVTGRKTILSYLMKPVLRAKQMALRER